MGSLKAPCNSAAIPPRLI